MGQGGSQPADDDTFFTETGMLTIKRGWSLLYVMGSVQQLKGSSLFVIEYLIQH